MEKSIKRIDLLLLAETRYGVLNHFTKKLHEAFSRLKVPSRLIPVENGSVALDWRDLPTFTICFNGVPSSNNTFLCDQIGVPHLALLVDHPAQFVNLIESPFMMIGCDDRSGVRILQQMNFSRSFFSPHAVESDLPFDSDAERIYGVSFLASYIDYEALRIQWQQMYPKNISQAMDDAVAVVFSENPISFVEALIQSIQNNVPESQDQNLYANSHILDLCCMLELYIKGKERADMIRAIKSADVHIFGDNLDGWKKEIKGQNNIILHSPLSFDEALRVMNQSKILLNSSIKNKEGAHERIFSGLALEAVVVTSDNSYLREQFVNRQDIELYQLDSLNETIREYLNDEDKRRSIGQSGRKKVMQSHTWDHRAQAALTLYSKFEAL